MCTDKAGVRLCASTLSPPLREPRFGSKHCTAQRLNLITHHSTRAGVGKRISLLKLRGGRAVLGVGDSQIAVTRSGAIVARAEPLLLLLGAGAVGGRAAVRGSGNAPAGRTVVGAFVETGAEGTETKVRNTRVSLVRALRNGWIFERLLTR